MDLSTLGLFVQTVGAGLLALIFLYLSRGKGNRVLNAAGYGWLFLFVVARIAARLAYEMSVPLANLPYQYFKILYFVCAHRRRGPDGPRVVSRAAAAARPRCSASRAPSASSPSRRRARSSTPSTWGIGAIAWFVDHGARLPQPRGRPRASSSPECSPRSRRCSRWRTSSSSRSRRPTHDQPFPFLALHGVLRPLPPDAVRHRPHHLGDGGHGAPADDGARARASTTRSGRRRRAQIDPLTDAYNRFFLDEIRPTLAREPAGGSIVLIDVDGLKTINDKEGHEEGDKAIWTVAAAIKKLIRGDDYLIRWGGDEFLVVLPGMDQEVAKKRFYMLPSQDRGGPAVAALRRRAPTRSSSRRRSA